tara:strand:+ start:587 stop:967 length:381 start_codon:yes stop_codon:yes gene_type:complete
MKTSEYRKSAPHFCVETWAATVKSRCKEERRKRKINQQEMADLLNIGLRTYQDKENPRKPDQCFDIVQMGKIANHLQVHLGSLAVTPASNEALNEVQELIMYLQDTAEGSMEQLLKVRKRMKSYAK